MHLNPFALTESTRLQGDEKIHKAALHRRGRASTGGRAPSFRRRLATIPAFAVLGAMLLFSVACSSSSDTAEQDDSTDTATAASDTEYIARICDAGATLFDELSTAVLQAEGADSDADAIAVVEPPFRKFADTFAQASPPADLKAWHADAVTATRALVDRIHEGRDLDTIGEMPFPDLPKRARARLVKVALDNPTCVASNFTFGETA